MVKTAEKLSLRPLFSKDGDLGVLVHSFFVVLNQLLTTPAGIELDHKLGAQENLASTRPLEIDFRVLAGLPSVSSAPRSGGSSGLGDFPKAAFPLRSLQRPWRGGER
jgi:hypothetical protein